MIPLCLAVCLSVCGAHLFCHQANHPAIHRIQRILHSLISHAETYFLTEKSRDREKQKTTDREEARKQERETETERNYHSMFVIIIIYIVRGKCVILQIFLLLPIRHAVTHTDTRTQHTAHIFSFSQFLPTPLARIH